MIMYIFTLNYVYNVYFKWSEVEMLNHGGDIYTMLEVY